MGYGGRAPTRPCPRPVDPRRRYCKPVVSTRAASLSVLPTCVRVTNRIGSAALTNCRHITTLRGPQYGHDQEPHRARTVSPVSVLVNLCRSSQASEQNSRESTSYSSPTPTSSSH